MSTASSMPTWKSARMSARRGPGRRRCDGAPVPGGEGGDLWIAAQGADQLRALPVDRRGRAAEEDREGRRVAEVFAQHPVGARGRSARDFDRARAELLLESDAEAPRTTMKSSGNRERRARVAQQGRACPRARRARGRPAPCSSLRTRTSLAVREWEGCENAEGSVKGADRGARSSCSTGSAGRSRCGSGTSSSPATAASPRPRCRSTRTRRSSSTGTPSSTPPTVPDPRRCAP